MAKTMNELDKAIIKIRTNGAALDALIQATGVEVLEHYAEHKACELVNRLFLALSAGSRKTAMASWLLAYGAVKVNTDAVTKKERPFVKDDTKETRPEAAAEDMWYNHKPEKGIDEVFDLQKAVMALLKRAGSATSLKHGDNDTLIALAGCVNIKPADMPALPVKVAKVEAPAA